MLADSEFTRVVTTVTSTIPMATLPASEEVLYSLEDYDDIISWINDTLSPSHSEDPSDDSFQSATVLTELDQHITHLIATLDIACEDTSSQLERIIDDVSRGTPRLAYDLHFMKDGAISLQNTLVGVHERSRAAVPQTTGQALDQLRLLDTMKTHMEAAREVLREAESWSSLELEVTSLLSERDYTKAAARLSEASRSMVVFQNTPDYDPRRALMVNLQNQLEASLSSALVAAINIQDLAACRNYFSIFSNIQRESEFRNYYNGSRRASVVSMWQNAFLSDCGSSPPATPPPLAPQVLIQFIPKFYGDFLSLLNQERTSIPAIFPDPALTLSTLISSVLSALQPTFSQRLSSLFTHYGDSTLKELIAVFRLTEDFASGVQKVMEKIKFAASLTSRVEEQGSQESIVSPPPTSHTRRRSMRMSVSWRAGPQRSQSGGLNIANSVAIADGLEWDQELFHPFLDFQVDYGTLEQRLLEDALRDIISNDSRDRAPELNQARLLRERAVDIFGLAEESLTRCDAFTHGYGAVGLVQALDGFFKSFVDMWTADVSMVSPSSGGPDTGDEDLSGLDYTAQDWSEFQQSLHLLSSAHSVYERMSLFELKLRSNLAQIAAKFRLARNDPTNFPLINSRGESNLLEQSSLNSAELQALLDRVESDPSQSREAFQMSSTAGLRHGQSHVQQGSGSTDPLLTDSRGAIFSFARACQTSLQGTILSPLRKHLSSYSSSSLWTTAGNPKSRHTVTSNDLQVPTFSLSPSDIVQRVAEGLLNLPRLFEVYADDDALSFSLHTLPHLDAEILKGLSDQHSLSTEPQTSSHIRRQSISSATPTPIDPEMVSSAWLASLGHSLLSHLTTDILPRISVLTAAGAAQLSSDLGYLSNIVRALNVEFEELEAWKEYADMDDDAGLRKVQESDPEDRVLQYIARMRGWGR